MFIVANWTLYKLVIQSVPKPALLGPALLQPFGRCEALCGLSPTGGLLRVWEHLLGHLSHPKVLWEKLRQEDMFGQNRVMRFHSPGEASRNQPEET